MRYEPRFHVVLYEPEIPQNTGNIGRTCVAAEAKLWIVRPCGFRLDSHHLRRSGMDYWENLEWQAVDDWAQLEMERGDGGQFWYFSKYASRTLWETPFSAGDTLVFGSESRGLPPSFHTSYAARSVALPMAAGVRSLNLASSVAIALYEAWRQVK